MSRASADTQALEAVRSRDPNSPSNDLPPFVTEELRKDIGIVNAYPSSRGRAEEDNYSRTLEDYSIAYAIAQDDFLSKHAELVKVLVTRSKAQALAEAADWLEKAIQKNSLEAILQLAKLHLEEDPIGQKSFAWVTSKYERPSSAASFVGSAMEAANLYKMAIARNSSPHTGTVGRRKDDR